MSKNVFFLSDNHFCHSNILNFYDYHGRPLRAGFSDVISMNEYMIEQWNSVVRPNDKVYHLGDIIISTSRYRFEEIFPKLNGDIVLIKGNHDKAKLSLYADYFRDVRSEVMLKHPKTLKKIIFSHRPIFLGEYDEASLNVHGHIHDKVLEDHRYFNVSVEQLNYRPIAWEELTQMIG